MNNHIAFEELVKFVWIDQITDESVALSLQINQHLMGCRDCAEKVLQLQTIHQDAQVLRRQRDRLAEANRLMDLVNNRILPEYGHFR